MGSGQAWRGGREAYAYVLFEHKSIPDRWVAFQLLRYMVRIWERNLRERGKLWPIVPLVVYHGRDQWWVEPTFGELIDAPATLKAYMPDYGYLLCDLKAYTDEDLKDEVLLQAAMLTLKYVFRPELRERLPGLMGLLHELAERETGLEYVETLLRYLAQAALYVEAEELREAVKAAFPQEGEALMSTIAQKWVEQGREQGLQQGLQQGKREGKRECVREGLLAGIELGLKLRFGSAGLQLLPEIYKVEDVDVLRDIHEGTGTVSTLDELALLCRPGDGAQSTARSNCRFAVLGPRTCNLPTRECCIIQSPASWRQFS